MRCEHADRIRIRRWTGVLATAKFTLRRRLQAELFRCFDRASRASGTCCETRRRCCHGKSGIHIITLCFALSSARRTIHIISSKWCLWPSWREGPQPVGVNEGDRCTQRFVVLRAQTNEVWSYKPKTGSAWPTLLAKIPREIWVNRHGHIATGVPGVSAPKLASCLPYVHCTRDLNHPLSIGPRT